jgi:translocation and assembly module TamB
MERYRGMKRKALYIIAGLLLLGLFLYGSRGPNISNALKKAILPELELATGKKFIAQHIYINILPFFIEMKDVKAFDEDGSRIFFAARIKGYLSLSGILKKEITIKRLSIKEPHLGANEAEMREITANVKKYLSEESKIPFKLRVKAVVVENGGAAAQYQNSRAFIEKINGEIIMSDITRVRFSTGNIRVVKEGMPEFSGRADAAFFLKTQKDAKKDGGFSAEIKSLKIISGDSEIQTSGEVDIKKMSGRLKTDIKLSPESVKEIFDLKNRGDGNIAAAGSVTFDGLKSIKNISVDLNVKGDMYLETLMELLEVEEPLKGHMIVNGSVKGALNNLNGSAKATLEKGNIFGVEIDRLSCNIAYKDNIMRFADGAASLYKGAASVEAMIELPVVDRYSFKVRAKEVNSKGIFKLIEWDPEIPEGRVSGEIESSGSDFNPTGSFHYRSIAQGNDILGRVKEVKGEFKMKNDVIHFPNMLVSTAKSNASVKGNADLVNNTLDLSGSGATTDMLDLLSPYFTALSGAGEFQYSVTGRLKDPVLGVKFSAPKTIFKIGEIGIPDALKNKTMNIQAMEGSAVYRKNLMTVKSFSAKNGSEEYKASGAVHFKNAKYLFDMESPDYDLNISAKSLDIKNLSDAFQDGPQFGGALNTDFRLYGEPKDIKASGDFKAKGFTVSGQHAADYGEGKVSYDKRRFSFNGVNIRRGNSSLRANGFISLDKEFSFSADSPKIGFADIVMDSIIAKNKLLELVSFTNAKVKGDGTLGNPRIEAKSDVQGASYKGVYPQHGQWKGKASGTLRNKRLDFNGSFFDGKMDLKGSADLRDKMPWSANINLQPARYDFIAALLLKEVPEDLLLNLTGNIKAYGDKDRINASAVINRAHMYLYGIGFTNNGDVRLSMEDKRLSISALSMKSETSEFRIGGNVLLGRSYDLMFEGSSSLSPLKAASKNIETIKGNGSFVFSVAGDWDKPKINGGMDVSGGALGIKDIHYRLSSISAYIYVDEDRIVLERASGRLSGGTVTMSGTAYLQKFSIKKFFLESKLDNITGSVSKDFWVNFDGRLYYQGTPESQNILGDIAIKKAKYSERVEWKSWLLKAKPKDKPKLEPARFDKTNLNIKIAGSNMIVDNNAARVSMRSDMLLRGTIGHPALLGKVETKEGIVYFRNNEFKIIKANLDFSDMNQINPYFDIVAETRVKNYNVRLNLDGYIEQFNLSLSSDPQLNETDIFSLLTVGQTGKHVKGLEGGIGAGEAASFLTGKMQDVFEERLKTITGFDRIQIDPSISKTTGTATPRLTIAKRLMGDKLYVTYSTAVGSGEEQVWKLEYILGKNTSLVGVRDERGGIGGDIKFRFEFK